MSSVSVFLSCLCLFLGVQVQAFAPLTTPTITTRAPAAFGLRATEEDVTSSMPSFDDDMDEDGEDENATPGVPAGMNPDRPELPELKGDFDWDAKFAGDEDWVTENVPGKMVVSELELAAQVTALTQLEEAWRKEAQWEEYEAARQVGWVDRAETMNGRFAMFFLITGLLTEYWTGISMPGQVEELLRVAGVIGFD
mmetsp:Transcript_16902/g.34918  ORF Transcript_16902/g.34918 Transcript_16902/m.34918 type:complete len:196 (-) Transcript_16902:75-662(-)